MKAFTFSTLCVLGIFISSIESVPIASIAQPKEAKDSVQVIFSKVAPKTRKVNYSLLQSSDELQASHDYKVHTNSEIGDLIKTRHNQNEPVAQNLHSTESSETIGKPNHLSKFYRNGYSRSVLTEDAIIFPNTGTKTTDTLDLFSKGNNSPSSEEVSNVQAKSIIPKHITRLLLRGPKPDYHPTDFDQLSPSEEGELSYETLIKLLRILLFSRTTVPSPQIPQVLETETSYLERNGNEGAKHTPSIVFSDEQDAIQTEDDEYIEKTTFIPSQSNELGTYSLYSGPKIKDSSCPPGQQRNHAGHCQVKSRKLGNSG